MKIRTRLLLFLLPTLIGSIALVSSLLAYNWHGEIIDGFKTRLRAAAVSAAALKKLDQGWIREELEITNLRAIPLDSPDIASIPKSVHITPVYKSAGKKVMTGYAPIYDEQGQITGLMAADISVGLIDEKFQECLLLILCSAGFTILIVVATLYFIANRISRPVQKLNNSALAIAAGQYGESIQVQGPKEIAQLANTLNTMSECLHENINRLKENSLLRERIYGEYECSMLLQHLMLQKNIDECRSDAVAVKPITFFSEHPKGLLLDFPKGEDSQYFHIHMAEAEEEGFEGMYQLLTRYKYSKESQTHTSLSLDKARSQMQWHGPLTPLVWSLEEGTFIKKEAAPIKVETGDFFFLFNRGFSAFYRDPQKIADFLSKALKVFAQDGLETTVSMLQKEIGFATKRKDLEEDIHLLCFQILNV